MFAAQAQDALYIHSGASLKAHAGSAIGIKGDIANNGLFDIENSCAVLCGTESTRIYGSQPLSIDTLVLKMGAQTTVETAVIVNNQLDFNQGILLTDLAETTNYVHFLAGATYTGADEDSYIQGRVRKTGNEAFIFPVGDSTDLQPIEISAPSDINDAFTAYYTRSNASDAGYSTSSFNTTCGSDVIVRDVTEKEFWSLERTNGSSEVSVTFHFDENSGIVDMSKLLVMNWDGSEWISQGSAGTTGTELEGTITAGTGCGEFRSTNMLDEFGIFTFGGADLTTLPIELISFNGQAENCAVTLDWTIEADGDLDHFEIQRSTDGNGFETIESIYGNTTTVKSYSYTDENPQSNSYYRLVSVDIFGALTTSEMIYIQQACDDLYPMNAYPSLTTANSTIKVDFYGAGETATFQITDLTGKTVQQFTTTAIAGANSTSIQLVEMAAGHYLINLLETGEMQRLVIQ